MRAKMVASTQGMLKQTPEGSTRLRKTMAVGGELRGRRHEMIVAVKGKDREETIRAKGSQGPAEAEGECGWRGRHTNAPRACVRHGVWRSPATASIKVYKTETFAS